MNNLCWQNKPSSATRGSQPFVVSRQKQQLGSQIVSKTCMLTQQGHDRAHNRAGQNETLMLPWDQEALDTVAQHPTAQLDSKLANMQCQALMSIMLCHISHPFQKQK